MDDSLTPSPADILIAMSREGLRLPFSIWLMAGRDTPIFVARASCEMPFSRRIFLSCSTIF